MRETILISLIISSNLLFGQPPSFSNHLKLDVEIDTTRITNEQLIATILTTKLPNRNEVFVWHLPSKSDNEPQFLGYIEETDGFYLPNNQILQGHLIIARVSEYNGIMLINDSTLIEIPGYYFGLSDNAIFTRAAGDGNLTVSCYNLLTGELQTKVWNNINGSDPWDIGDNYNYKDFQWIHMR